MYILKHRALQNECSYCSQPDFAIERDVETFIMFIYSPIVSRPSVIHIAQSTSSEICNFSL